MGERTTMTRRRRGYCPGQSALEYEYHIYPFSLDGTDGGYGRALGFAINIPSQGAWVRVGRQTSEIPKAYLSFTWSL